MARSKGRAGRPWRRVREQLKRLRLPCHICGQAIDYDLPPDNPRCFVADHVVPIRYGGDPLAMSNLAAAHKICNGRKGTKATSEVTVVPQSREW